MTLGCAPPSDAVVQPAIHPPTPALTRVASPPAPANCQLPHSCVLAMAGFALYSHTKIQKYRESSECFECLFGILLAGWLSFCHCRAGLACSAWHACCWWWYGCPWFVLQLTCPTACHLTPTPPTSLRPSCSGAARHLPHSLRHRQRCRACTSQGRGSWRAPPRRQRQRHHAAPTCVALPSRPLAC